MDRFKSKHKFSVLKNISYFTDPRRLELCDVIIDEGEATVRYVREENIDPAMKKMLAMIKRKENKRE